jgi:hypothetical protein
MIVRQFHSVTIAIVVSLLFGLWFSEPINQRLANGRR